MTNKEYTDEAVRLLKLLISTPSASRSEDKAADIMEETIRGYELEVHRLKNNVWTIDPEYDDARPTLLLNAHIDTVKPVASWTRDPYSPTIEGDKLYGLGSNDCGGGLTTLLQIFRKKILEPREYNLIYLVAIVGEPTDMQPAIAERGLMVLDVIAHGKSGHAARNEGVNAIYKAMDDLLWLRDYKFEKVSPLLGPTKMTVTVINAGTQHNVVPDTCTMLVDVRTNEMYTNHEVFDIISHHLSSEVKAHSFRLHSSHIAEDHPLVKRCKSLGLQPFGSPTLSDQALMPWQSLKLGPGSSCRSHSADEYICLSEIERAFEIYDFVVSEKTPNNT